MKAFIKLFSIAFLLIIIQPAFAQSNRTLTIEECYQLARQNYPLVKQRELITKSKAYSIQNIANGFLPQINFTGHASYQSAVTKIPIKIPGMDVPEISKDQYKVYGEVSQWLYDGGVIKEQKKLQEANSTIDEQKLEVELYNLKQTINQLFFGILLTNEQLVLNDLLKKNIEAGLRKMLGAIEYGTALRSNADVLKAEILNADQHAIELRSSRNAYLKMLGLFINQLLDENVNLIRPEGKPSLPEIRRPELLLFNTQQKAFDMQRRIVDAKNRPKIGLFFQGGAGRPALNFLSNNFDPYYIGGIRLNWSLSGLYNSKNDKALLDNNRKTIDIQKEIFLFNTNLSSEQETEEIKKLDKLLVSDEDIVDLRSNVKKAALAQLENGVITSNDYIREVNAEDMARQNKVLHEIQLLLAEYNQQITAGD
ncbi:MAG: TolC family protein [Ginsengibacter sp.]